MSSPSESGAAAERPIRRLLVRYGRSGSVAWFGTIHDVQVARGDAVVVLPPLGEWLGVVLRETSSTGETQSGELLSGELLRRLDETDQPRSAEAKHRSLELAERARQEVRTLHSHSAAATPRGNAGSLGPAFSLTVIDAEVSLCGRSGVVWYAGRGGPALGPAAARLADAVGLERVQWMPLEAPSFSSDGPGPTTTTAAAKLNEQAPPGGQAGAAEMALAALRAADPVELGRVARRAREPLGMLGAYVQKIRGEAGADHHHTATSIHRRWMIRLRATAGGVTLGQLEQLSRLAQRFGNGSLRLTMRQGLQLHGVVPGSADELLRAIDALAMTTRGSCGNVFRNVTCCPHAPRSAAASAARQLAATITQQWLPRAEWLSWTLDADGPAAAEDWQRLEFDAAYPEGYLPHKWKVGVATAEDNCIDVLTNDVALVVRPSGASEAIGVDCYVGGSLAYRPGEPGSFAMLAEPLGRLALADVDAVLRGLTQVHRQISGAGPRHWRRLKYVVRRIGTRELAERIEHAVGRPGMLSPLADEPRASGEAMIPGWRGHPPWTQGSDGRWTRTVGVVGGRMRFTNAGAGSAGGANDANDANDAGDAGGAWLRLCRFGRGLRIGPRHTLVIEGISERDRVAVDALITGPLAELAAEDGVELTSSISGEAESTACGLRPSVPRVLACVALPSCPLAVAEAERTAGAWRRALEPVAGEAALLASRDAGRQPTAAISGCSNGCSHPLTSTVGIVAEGPGRFRVFAGGDGRVLGVDLGTVAGPAGLAERVQSVAEQFRREGRDGEEFVDWWNRCRNRQR